MARQLISRHRRRRCDRGDHLGAAPTALSTKRRHGDIAAVKIITLPVANQDGSANVRKEIEMLRVSMLPALWRQYVYKF